MLELSVLDSTGCKKKLSHNTLRFPGGELHVSVEPAETNAAVVALHIVCLCKCADDVMALFLATDALRRMYPGLPLSLTLPYVPYARQDRVANVGEALSARVFCDLINTQAYSTVFIEDPHSDVVPALLNNVVVVELAPTLARLLEGRVSVTEKPPVLVAPDAGARKRVQKLAQYLSLDVLCAEKVRDTVTGRISGTALPSSLPDAPLLVVDDICDGGWTFIALAKAAKEIYAKQGREADLSLYVTHGIFSKGIDVLLEHYLNVYTRYDWTNSGKCLLV